MESKSPSFTLTIMPDYGFGPYAWLKDATDTSSLIGECVATAVDGFELPDGAGISAELQAAFAAWTSEFECGANSPHFDWRAFHENGLRLSNVLKRELGSDFKVVYHKPCEDPEFEHDETTEIGGAA